MVVKTGQINVPYQSRNSFNYVSLVVKDKQYSTSTGEANPLFWQSVRSGYYAGNVGISDELRFPSGTFVLTGLDEITVLSIKGHDITVEFFLSKNIDNVRPYGYNGCSIRDRAILRPTNEIVSSSEDNNVWYATISTVNATGYEIGLKIKIMTLTAGDDTMTVYAIFLAESTSYDSSVYPVDDTSWNSVPADPYISRDDRITITLTVDSSYGNWTDGVVSYSGHFIEVSASEAVLDSMNIYVDATDANGVFHSGLHYTLNRGETVSKAFYRKEDWVDSQLVSGIVRLEILDDKAIYEVVNNLDGFTVEKSLTSNTYSGGKLTPIVVDTSLPGEPWDDGSDDPSTYDSFDEWYSNNENVSTNYGEDDNTVNEDNIIGYSSRYIYEFLEKIYGNGWSIDSSGNAKFNTITISDGGLNLDLDIYSTIAYSDLMDASLKNYIDEQIENIDIVVDGSIDLSNYATRAWVESKCNDVSNSIQSINSSIQDISTFIQNLDSSIQDIDLSNYATILYVNDADSSLLTHSNSEDSSILNYVNNKWVVIDEDDYDNLETIDPNVFYFIV